MSNEISSSSSSESEQIIQPAPAQTSVSTPTNARTSSPQSNNNSSSNSSRREGASNRSSREDHIRSLMKQLRIINNVCGPLTQYMAFQQHMSPEMRVVIDVNQWVGLMFAAKVGITSVIDQDYMDIVDPPESLKKSMETAYSNIDSVTNSFTESMKQIITVMQAHQAKPLNSSSSIDTSVQSNISILSAMTSSPQRPLGDPGELNAGFQLAGLQTQNSTYSRLPSQ